MKQRCALRGGASAAHIVVKLTPLCRAHYSKLHLALEQRELKLSGVDQEQLKLLLHEIEEREGSLTSELVNARA